MKATTPATYLLLLWLFLLGACGNASERSGLQEAVPPKITIAVAANMQFAINELTESFTKKTGIPCETVISSSGKLTAQIREGAPFDVFISADMKYPEEIYKSGLASGPPKVYAYGKLVLWSMKEGIDPSLSVLADENIRHIAVANPKLAPYGVAAVETLRKHQLLDRVESKLVYGESIAQTNQFIITGSTEAGFTAMSVVLSPQMQGQGKWIGIDQADYPPIEQGAVVIKRMNGPVAEAEKFYDFLASEEARSILESFGYAVGDPS
jgi:molybdate transport system substrate-binding protein